MESGLYLVSDATTSAMIINTLVMYLKLCYVPNVMDVIKNITKDKIVCDMRRRITDADFGMLPDCVKRKYFKTIFINPDVHNTIITITTATDTLELSVPDATTYLQSNINNIISICTNCNINGIPATFYRVHNNKRYTLQDLTDRAISTLLMPEYLQIYAFKMLLRADTRYAICDVE